MSSADPSSPAATPLIPSSLDLNKLIQTHIATNPASALVAALNQLLRCLPSADLLRLVHEIIGTLTDRAFHARLLAALGEHLKAHPFATAFLVLGIVLMVNPLTVAAFGAMGPVAGSLAAAWQASIGGEVAAGSAFAVLQSWGMLYSVVIPVAGAVIVAGAAAAAPVVREGAVDTVIVAREAGLHVGRWSEGEYGSPVASWWSGAYGNPVADWWGGKHGAPVSEWAKEVVDEKRGRNNED